MSYFNKEDLKDLKDHLTVPPMGADQEMRNALRAYWAAKTPEEECIAYARMRLLGAPPSYGEPHDDVWHEPWSHGGSQP